MSDQNEAEWRTRLGPEDDDWAAVANDPERFARLLGSEAENLVEMARADVEGHLTQWFTPVEGWRHDPVRSGPIGTGWFGTEWTFGGRHDRDVVFNGLPATGNHVTVRGFTLIGTEEGATRASVRRYVDWVGLFGQLRLTVNWRLPHQPDPAPDPEPDES